MAPEQLKTIIQASNLSQSPRRAELENMNGWRGYSSSAVSKHGHEVYLWLRAQCGPADVRVAISKFCDGGKRRTHVYDGLGWLRQHGFILQDEGDGIRRIIVQPVPDPPEGTDPRQANKGAAVYGTRVLRETNAAGTPCEGEVAKEELDDLYGCFELDQPTGRRRLQFYLELRRAVLSVHWEYMAHTTRQTVSGDLAHLEKFGLIVDCRSHGVVVVTAPLPQDWAPADEDAVCGAWVEACREAAKRSLLQKSSDQDRLLEFYLDLCRSINQTDTVTALDRRAARELLKDRTFEQIRPSLTYFMRSAKDDLGDVRVTAENIRAFGLTLATYHKNLAGVEVGYGRVASAYRKNPDEAWEHMLKTPGLQKWRIHPLRVYPDQTRRA